LVHIITSWSKFSEAHTQALLCHDLALNLEKKKENGINKDIAIKARSVFGFYIQII
jgi:hypothetical protein